MLDKELAAIPNKRLYSTQESFPFDRCVIFGAGGRGRAVAWVFRKKGIRVEAFFDNAPTLQGAQVAGVPVLPPAEAGRFADTPLVVASHWFHEVAAQLRAQGRAKAVYDFAVNGYFFVPDLLETHGERIRAVHDCLADEASRRAYLSVVKSVLTGEDGYLSPAPYVRYHHPLVRPRPGDVVVDGGAYDGSTVVEFYNLCQRQGAVYAFEPLADSFARLTATLERERLGDAVQAVQKGLWDSAATLRFNTRQPSAEACRVDDAGDLCIETVALDQWLDGRPVDLIKLDVEGSELKALIGAEATLRRFRPKLQICLYHKVEDLWTIPEYLRSLDLGYAFYVGHSNTIMVDTVLYAAARPEHLRGA